MSKFSKQGSRFRRTSGLISLAVLLSARSVPAQSAPVSPDHPWHSAAERQIEQDARRLSDYRPWHSPGEHEIEAVRRNLADSRFGIDPAKRYSLGELIDLAETHNPATRVAWERARAQAAALGVATSELYPTLAAAALSQTSRSEVLFGNSFFGQVIQDFQLELNFNYTVFDFGARAGRINAASAQVLAANFAFNDTHRKIIYEVQQAYYRLLSSMGQEEAARASLSNAQAVQEAAEQRLANGLATLPDMLEARSATAQADYDLQAIIGAEEIARGDLATAVGTAATTVIHVQPLDQVLTPESIADTVEGAINRALGQRPDLMQQLAAIRSTDATVKEARAANYPTLSLNISPALPSLYGLQPPNLWSHTADLTGGLLFNLQWTTFDGGARKNRLAEARADARAAEAQAEVKLDEIADEVWIAYSNLNTAFRQRQAAVALLEAARQSYSAALESYNSGLRTLLDVTAAQRTLAQARSADVQARTAVLSTFADLAFTTGDSIQANKGRPQP
jgi:outer membrane protein